MPNGRVPRRKIMIHQEDETVKLMERADGWFSADEARLLFRATTVVTFRQPDGAVVEIGSFHGRSTIVLGCAVLAAKTKSPPRRVVAIDPHEGDLTGRRVPPSWDAFIENINEAGLSSIVTPIRKRASDVEWSDPIAMLMIDGLHDYANVAADYKKFSAFVPVDGFIAFHDYSNPDYPDVRKFVDERVRSGELAVWGLPNKPCAESSLIVTRRRPSLSVVIPTIGRPSLADAIESLLAEGLGTADEIIVIGEGPQPTARKIVELFSGRVSITYLENQSDVINTNRNVAQLLATRTHLMFLDDDDRSVDGAIRCIIDEISQNPNRVLLFRERCKNPRHTWNEVWRKKEIVLGNVGTQMVVVPNVRKRLGKWGCFKTGDYNFIRSTVDLWPGKDDGVVWVDRVIAELY